MSSPDNTTPAEFSEALGQPPALLHGRVLVGMDDAVSAEQIRDILTKAGSEVVVTRSGQAIVEALEAESPELLLLDTHPDRPLAPDFIQKIKAISPVRYLPVVIVLADGDEPEQNLSAGADDFLRFPVHPSEIVLRVRMLLRLGRMHLDLIDNNSELQAAYETARESEAKYRALIHDAQDALTLIDPQTSTITEVNRRARELTGYTEDNLIGQRVNLLCPQIEAGRWQEILAEVMARGRVEISEIDMQRKDGETIPVELYVSLASHHLGEPLIQALARDIRPRRQLEAERTKSERLSAVVETAVTVNHEINNPLLVITSSVESLQRSLFNAEAGVREKLERINEACGRIQRFTQQLASVIDPVSKDYLPGMKMLDIQQSVAAPGEATKK